MIRLLQGTIQSVEENGAVVAVAGVGYFVFFPSRILETMSVGKQVIVHTSHYVREDTSALYGFTDKDDLLFFEQLLRVTGVGPRIALALLAECRADEVKRAIIHGDTAFLESIPGIGRKTAERILIDLKESIVIHASELTEKSKTGEIASVVDALLSLGYSKAEALHAARRVDRSLPLETQIRSALKELSAGKKKA